MKKTTWCILPTLAVFDQDILDAIDKMLGEESAKVTADAINKLFGKDVVKAQEVYITPKNSDIIL